MHTTFFFLELVYVSQQIWHSVDDEDAISPNTKVDVVGGVFDIRKLIAQGDVLFVCNGGSVGLIEYGRSYRVFLIYFKEAVIRPKKKSIFLDLPGAGGDK